ncbi:PadR family transcriptional regulator [Actinopolyspora sp. H202]|uniref:PadR family transcriptional regulator n=1 Tax=Actinopolyspora sp. H202 TaxID=1500456 RepID=UPI003EE54A20
MTRRAMSEQSFLVLTVLADGPLHGYGIVRAVSELSRQRVVLRVGTLYGVIDRLCSDGLVELDSEQVHNGRLRRYYRITDNGLTTLVGETARRSDAVRAATERLRTRGLQPESGGTA